MWTVPMTASNAEDLFHKLEVIGDAEGSLDAGMKGVLAVFSLRGEMGNSILKAEFDVLFGEPWQVGAQVPGRIGLVGSDGASGVALSQEDRAVECPAE